MTKPFPYLILLIALLAGTSGCSKSGVAPVTKQPVSDLPPATQTGANKMAWHTDGIPFVADGISTANVGFGTDPNSSDYNLGYFVIMSSSVSKTGYEQAIALSSPSVGGVIFPIKPGTVFQIAEHTENYLAEHIDQGTGTTSGNFMYAAKTGQITITFNDINKRIIAGTFSFTTEQTGATVKKITDGWFDVKY